MIIRNQRETLHYLIIQNADPKKEIVAFGQTYFATQTRRQELADQQLENERRLMLREEMRRHNTKLADAAMPEHLPTPESVKKLEGKKRKEIGDK